LPRREVIGNEAAHARCRLSDAVPVQAGSIVGFLNGVADVISGDAIEACNNNHTSLTDDRAEWMLI